MTVQLAAINRGEQGPPLIICHGLFGSGRNWGGICRRFSQSGRQVIAVDLRNHGKSPHSDEMSYPAMAEDLLRFLDERDLHAADFCGHSMGGKVAMTLALQHQILLGALVVVDIAPTAYPHTHEPLVEAMKSLDLAAIRNRREAEMQLEKAIPEKALRQFLLQNLRSTSDGLRWRINLEVIHRQMGALTGFDVAAAPCDIPSLFIYGTQSEYVSPKTTPAIFKHFPKARLAPIEGAGHWLHAQEPQRFIQAFQDFADTLAV